MVSYKELPINLVLYRVPIQTNLVISASFIV